MAEAIVSGHFGGAGLDAETLTMMLDAVGAFVAHALPPQRQLQLERTGLLAMAAMRTEPYPRRAPC